MVTLSHIKFLSAIDAAVRKDTAQLAKILRGPSPLTDDQRHKLADFIEGKLKRPAHRPRKIYGGNAYLMAAAYEVENLIADWRKAGRRYRICAPAIESIAKKWEERGITPKNLENFMSRSKQPRKSR